VALLAFAAVRRAAAAPFLLGAGRRKTREWKTQDWKHGNIMWVARCKIFNVVRGGVI